MRVYWSWKQVMNYWIHLFSFKVPLCKRRPYSGPYFSTFAQIREFLADLVTFTGEILNGKLHFFLQSFPQKYFMRGTSQLTFTCPKSRIEKDVKYVQRNNRNNRNRIIETIENINPIMTSMTSGGCIKFRGIFSTLSNNYHGRFC